MKRPEIVCGGDDLHAVELDRIASEEEALSERGDVCAHDAVAAEGIAHGGYSGGERALRERVKRAEDEAEGSSASAGSSNWNEGESNVARVASRA